MTWPKLFGGGTRTTLRGLIEPARVRIEATVASANTVQSPVTGARGVVMVCEVHGRYQPGGEYGHQRESQGEFFRLLKRMVFGSPLLLAHEDLRIALAWPGFDVRFEVASGDHGEPVERALPEGWMPTTHGDDVLHYRESVLRCGDPVRLIARVNPMPRVGEGYRRSEGDVDFVADYSHEAAVIEDRSVEALG